MGKLSQVKILGFSLLLAILIISLIFSTAVSSAPQEKITIAVDLAHGESDKYLNYIMGNITELDGRPVEWVVIEEKITSEVLANVDILILGQPTTSFALDEIEAIMEWLDEGNKVLWVASDSDYGGGPSSQKACNELLEAIGAKLRVETGAVYDDVYNAQRFYRVLGFVKPDLAPYLYTDIISEGITNPVLYHGPTVVIWIDEEGNPRDPVTDTFPFLIRIVWNSDVAYIADNNPPPLMLYSPIADINRTFVMLAAEYWIDKNNIIIVSGESPYGDYEPTWAWEYYGVTLDGPKFVTNMLRWSAKVITEGPLLPKITVTEVTVVTETVTETLIETTTAVVTETEVLTETVTEIETVTETVTQTTTEISTITTTEYVTEWTTTAVVGIILLIIGLGIGLLIRRK